MSAITLPEPLVLRAQFSNSTSALLSGASSRNNSCVDLASSYKVDREDEYSSNPPSPPPTHDEAYRQGLYEPQTSLARNDVQTDQQQYDLPAPIQEPVEAILQDRLSRFDGGHWNFLRRLAFRNPFQDVPYLLALLSVTGSTVWIIEGILLLLPVIRGTSMTVDEQAMATGIVAFIGTSISVTANMLLLLETICQLQGQRFGWRLVKTRAMQSNERALFLLERAACPYHPALKENFLLPGDDPAADDLIDPEDRMRTRMLPQLPSFAEIKGHYLRETGFLACLAQLVAAFCYCAANVANMPGVREYTQSAHTKLIFSALRVVGGAGFTFAGLLYTIEAQRNWLKPEPGTLGWQIGLFSIVGGAGFLTSTSLGMQRSSWAVYVSALMTLWGSAAFLIAGIVQLYESLDKYPLVVRNISVESGLWKGEKECGEVV